MIIKNFLDYDKSRQVDICNSILELGYGFAGTQKELLDFLLRGSDPFPIYLIIEFDKKYVGYIFIFDYYHGTHNIDELDKEIAVFVYQMMLDYCLDRKELCNWYTHFKYELSELDVKDTL